jgi:hypothetical protein
VEQISNEISVSYSDKEIGGLLNAIGGEQRSFTRHFNQSEDFFLLLEDEYTVPHIQIHHDVRAQRPSPEYIAALKGVIEQVVLLAPQVFKELAYFFDPAEILRPCFYHVYRLDDNFYLYLLRIDLMMRAAESAVVERGTNDTTPLYRSRRLFLETTVLPLEGVVRQDGVAQSFHIRQTISQTWIGEQGRGYFVQGIWMDADLTKFFSRLFLPAGMKSYPYFPYLCKYKTVCQSLISLSPEGRARAIPDLHRSLQFLLPAMDRIQAEMKDRSFSEEMGFFKELKGKIPPAWYESWKNMRVEAYLNDSEMREFRIED